MADQRLPLYATGNPAPMPVPNQPPPLDFAPAQAQPPGSNLLGVLTGLAGLAANIGSISQGRGGQAGAGLLQVANQQLGQSAENQKDSQRRKEMESEAEALVRQARNSNLSPDALNTIETFAKNRQVDKGFRELDRELSMLRQRTAQAKAEKAYTVGEVNEAYRQSKDALKSHPGAVSSFLSDFADEIKDDDTLPSLRARLQSASVKAGVKLDKNSSTEFARQMLGAKNNALNSRRTGGFFGIGASDVPEDQWKSAGNIFREGLANPGDVEEYKTVKSQHEELKNIAQLVRAKPGSPRYKQGIDRLEALRSGQPMPENTAAAAPSAKQNVNNVMADRVAEVERLDKKSGKTAIFNEKTKEFLRWK